MSSERVEIVGPREQGLMDRSVLGQWLTRAGFTSKACVGFVARTGGSWSRRMRSVAQRCERRAAEPVGDRLGVRRGDPRHGRVVRYVRHDDGAASAVVAASLDQRNLVTHRR